MKLRERVGLSERVQHALVWLMEVGLAGMFLVGLYLGHTGIIVNCGIALLVAQLPPILQRDYGIPMDLGLTLWITTAVFLHALGTIPLPASLVEVVGSAPEDAAYSTLYSSDGWWDHLTHGFSASVVAGVGYATARALDEYASGVHFPPRFMFVYILLFVIAFGVLWEVIEFAIGEAAVVFGVGTVLTQYGLSDTMLDLVFDTVGGVVVGVWGTAHLNDVAEALGQRFGVGG
ncbi:hypothetical protein ACFPYI_15985 [Halomarina salina]|uniref:DUF2238 domain-containing protein n=1 Tax=Halomarina salina TaxID=1872699 RepID=A0ABD5RR13_9EURY|nr:hypothetical protein [Halomarina salina]